MDLSALPWDFVLILFVLGAIVPWRGVVRVRALLSRPKLETSDRLVIYASTMAFQWAAAGATAWRCLAHGWSAPSLGVMLSRPAATISLGAALALVIAGVQVAGLRQLSRIPADRRGVIQEMARKLLPQSLAEALPFVALVCTVSLCEEFLFRGFVFAVFDRLFGGSAAAGILCSAALFGVGHLYQGRRGVGGTFVLGVIFASTRVWTGSLAPSVIAHLVLDLVVGLTAPRVLSQLSGKDA